MTEITLYNTRTRRKEPFVPIDPKNVRMYVCGPTVYDRAHIGNARPAVVFDVLYRLLRHVYGAEHVTYARNFTDVDDRIIERAVATKGADESLEAAIRRITDETIGWYHEDMGALGVMLPNHEPRCTEYITPMVEMTQVLIDKGHAYEAEGHVLFAVDSWREKYGSLSGRSVDDMIAGARVEVAPYKRNPMDFVIWKPSTEEQPGWDSPWGRGRPGWHIECSAMAKELLGEVFDIHGGGIDLQFPHHENELTQSCCAHDTDVMANWWMHNEMLRVEGEKMSKSLGNFFTVRDLLDQGIPGEVIRFMLLSTHYRQPLDWTERRVIEAKRVLERWRLLLFGANGKLSPDPRVVEALSEDLNLAKAMAVLHDLAADGNGNALKSTAKLLGLLTEEQAGWFVPDTPDDDRDERVDILLKIRKEARSRKDFQLGDSIRDGLNEAGFAVQDQKSGESIYFKSRRLPQRCLLHKVNKLLRSGDVGTAESVAKEALNWGLQYSFPLEPPVAGASVDDDYDFETASNAALNCMSKEFGALQ